MSFIDILKSELTNRDKRQKAQTHFKTAVYCHIARSFLDAAVLTIGHALADFSMKGSRETYEESKTRVHTDFMF